MTDPSATPPEQTTPEQENRPERIEFDIDRERVIRYWEFRSLPSVGILLAIAWGLLLITFGTLMAECFNFSTIGVVVSLLITILLGAVSVIVALWLSKIVISSLRLFIRQGVYSFHYRVEHHHLYISQHWVLWGFTFYRIEKQIPLEKITDLVQLQGFLQSLMGIWVLRIQTSNGTWTPEACLWGLKDPQGVRDKLRELMRIARSEW